MTNSKQYYNKKWLILAIFIQKWLILSNVHTEMPNSKQYYN